MGESCRDDKGVWIHKVSPSDVGKNREQTAGRFTNGIIISKV